MMAVGRTHRNELFKQVYSIEVDDQLGVACTAGWMRVPFSAVAIVE